MAAAAARRLWAGSAGPLAGDHLLITELTASPSAHAVQRGCSAVPRQHSVPAAAASALLPPQQPGYPLTRLPGRPPRPDRQHPRPARQRPRPARPPPQPPRQVLESCGVEPFSQAFQRNKAQMDGLVAQLRAGKRRGRASVGGCCWATGPRLRCGRERVLDWAVPSWIDRLCLGATHCGLGTCCRRGARAARRRRQGGGAPSRPRQAAATRTHRAAAGPWIPFSRAVAAGGEGPLWWVFGWAVGLEERRSLAVAAGMKGALCVFEHASKGFLSCCADGQLER